MAVVLNIPKGSTVYCARFDSAMNLLSIEGSIWCDSCAGGPSFHEAGCPKERDWERERRERDERTRR